MLWQTRLTVRLKKTHPFEREVSEAAQAATGRSARGIMLPTEVLRSWAQRDINTSDDSALIAEDFRGGDFVDVLRNASSVMAAGATVLNGLQGDVANPEKISRFVCWLDCN